MSIPVTRSFDIKHVPVTTPLQQKNFECNELTLVNKGTQIATIDAIYPLYPGESVTYVAWPGERNEHVYAITFPSNVNGCLVIAICKTYK